MTLSENEESIQLITFNIGQKLFGFDILSIREIVRDPDIETLDQGPTFVDGIVRIRGEVVPVIDLKHRMRVEDEQRSDQGSHAWIMIANTDKYVAGFMCDAVTRILKINPDTILSAPDLVRDGMQRSYIHGVCASEAGMMVVLDIEQLLTAEEITELNQTDVRQ